MIIANRSLKVRQGQNDTDVAVRIFAPQPSQGSWSCNYEIEWPEGIRKGTASGFDSVQALLFALKMIGAEVYTSDYHKSGALTWTEPQQGYGFPVAQSLRDLLVGDDAKYL
jgi:hypothetical protein